MRDVLLIDNLDSFSFNLVEAFERLDCRVSVRRNTIATSDAIALATADDALIVLSPGPGRPEDAGSLMDIVDAAIGRCDVLGICLGQQAIVLHAGGQVDRAPVPVHGKAWPLDHDGRGPFTRLPGPLRVGRYHSLCTPNPPERFTVHARIGAMAMAISDRAARQTGLQFHPESILTRDGDAMLANILAGR